MGSPAGEAGRADDEGPQVKSKLNRCGFQKTELTWSEYKLFMSLYPIFKEESA